MIMKRSKTEDVRSRSKRKRERSVLFFGVLSCLGYLALSVRVVSVSLALRLPLSQESEALPLFLVIPLSPSLFTSCIIHQLPYTFSLSPLSLLFSLLIPNLTLSLSSQYDNYLSW